MPQLKERVTLACSDDPDLHAAFAVVSDPESKEEHWLEACLVLQKGSPNGDSGALPASMPQSPQSPRSSSLKVGTQNSSKLRKLLKLPLMLAMVAALAVMLLAGRALFYCGLQIYQNSDSNTSASVLKAACTLNPFASDQHSRLARVLREISDDAGAAREATIAILLDRKNFDGYIERSWARRALGLDQEAVNDGFAAYECDSESADSFAAIGLAQMGVDRPNAKQNLSTAISLGAVESDVYLSRAILEQEDNELDLALDDITSGITLCVAGADIYALRGQVHKGLGRYEAAIRDYQQAIWLEGQQSAGLSATPLGSSTDSYFDEIVALRKLIDAAGSSSAKAVTESPTPGPKSVPSQKEPAGRQGGTDEMPTFGMPLPEAFKSERPIQ